MRERGRTVGILAVDPSSPFTGGALDKGGAEVVGGVVIVRFGSYNFV